MSSVRIANLSWFDLLNCTKYALSSDLNNSTLQYIHTLLRIFLCLKRSLCLRPWPQPPCNLSPSLWLPSLYTLQRYCLAHCIRPSHQQRILLETRNLQALWPPPSLQIYTSPKAPSTTLPGKIMSSTCTS